jgi:hypothetical protein
MTKKIVIIIPILLILLFLISQIEIKQEIHINEINIKLLDHNYYKELKIEDVNKIEISKYTEGGVETKEITDKDEILNTYNSFKNIILTEETQMACEDTTTIYKFITNDKEYKIEKECNWFVINNKRYLYKK